MARPEDLMGLGMDPQTAGLLGQATQTVTCAGTTRGAATPILASTGVALLNGQSSQTGALLPNGALNDPLYVIGTGAVAPVLYPNNASGTINGAASFTMSAAVSGYILIQTATTSAGVDTWYTIPKV